ncbi:MAG: hypothetical protein WBE72_02160 [Terracidiphilus sp.]
MSVMVFLFSFDSAFNSGNPNGFDYSQSVAIDPAGNIYLPQFSTIQKLNSAGVFEFQLGSDVSGQIEGGEVFSLFASVTTDAAGNLYVLDTFNYVSKFDGSGKLITRWGPQGVTGAELAGIGLDSSGNVYVGDSENNCIRKFNGTGSPLLTWGSAGSGNGQFNQLQDLAVDGEDNVYVADYGNSRVQKFDSSGVFQLAWGSKGSADGQFGSGPFGVAADPAGSLYVTDPGNARIQKFDGSGVFKFAWGSQGSGSGQFKFGYYSILNFQNLPAPSPGGVAVDLQGNVYVLDPGNSRCQKFYEIETPELTFQPVTPQNMAIFVLGSDGNLWLETGPFGTQIPPARLQVDSNAAAFQALDSNDVIVLGSDGNLWLETWPFGNVAQTVQTRRQIDGNVAAFQAVMSGYGDNVFVLGTDGNLWWETWPPSGSVAQTIALRKQIDANVKKFVPLDVNDVFVLGADGNLWWEGLPFGSVAQTMKNRRQVDANVNAFQPIDGYNIYVLGNDGNLWLESWPSPPPNAQGYDAWGNVQETMQNRKQVDGNVAAFQAIDVNRVFVLGQDGNLWLETSPWGNVGQTVVTRQHIDTNIEAFYVWVDWYNLEGNWMVFVKDTDHALWYDMSSTTPPSTTWTRVQVDRNVM